MQWFYQIYQSCGDVVGVGVLFVALLSLPCGHEAVLVSQDIFVAFGNSYGGILERNLNIRIPAGAFLYSTWTWFDTCHNVDKKCIRTHQKDIVQHNAAAVVHTFLRNNAVDEVESKHTQWRESDDSGTAMRWYPDTGISCRTCGASHNSTAYLSENTIAHVPLDYSELRQ